MERSATSASLLIVAVSAAGFACAGPAASWPLRLGSGQARQDSKDTDRAVAGGHAMPKGLYLCSAYGEPRSGLDFRVTDKGHYTPTSGGSSGDFEIGKHGAVTFTGFLAQVMPSGSRALYHLRNGRPTVTFVTPGAVGDAYCDRDPLPPDKPHS